MSTTTDKKKFFSAETALRSDIVSLLSGRRTLRRSRQTKNTRIESGVEKSHRVDARCISEKPISRSNIGVVLAQTGQRTEPATPQDKSKEGYQEGNKAPRYVKGFQLFDKVRLDGGDCFVFGRRQSGYFDVRRLDGTRVSPSVRYKKWSLVEPSSTLLIERREGDSSHNFSRGFPRQLFMMQQYSISDTSQISETRRLFAGICKKHGFNETDIGKVELVMTEMATNLMKHAKGGEILAFIYRDNTKTYVSLLSLDQGPGIINPGQCLQDGHSTAGSSGTGLGAIHRLSSYFDFYSRPGQGAALLSIISMKDSSASSPYLPSPLGVICLPLKGEEACGDNYALKKYSDRIVFLLVDGLGHGLLAAEAALKAVASFHPKAQCSPKKILEDIHESLRRSRGAAIGIATLFLEEPHIIFCGIGNIRGRIISFEKGASMLSYSGIVGLEIRKSKEFTYPFSKEDLLILHSDGLSSRWHRDDYPGLWFKHPALIAGALYRDHKRIDDDCSILVVRGKDLL